MAPLNMPTAPGTLIPRTSQAQAVPEDEGHVPVPSVSKSRCADEDAAADCSGPSYSMKAGSSQPFAFRRTVAANPSRRRPPPETGPLDDRAQPEPVKQARSGHGATPRLLRDDAANPSARPTRGWSATSLLEVASRELGETDAGQIAAVPALRRCASTPWTVVTWTFTCMQIASSTLRARPGSQRLRAQKPVRDRRPVEGEAVALAGRKCILGGER